MTSVFASLTLWSKSVYLLAFWWTASSFWMNSFYLDSRMSRSVPNQSSFQPIRQDVDFRWVRL